MAGIEDLTPAEQQQLRFGKMLLEANPELVMEAKKLAKKVNPNLRLPEVDLEEKLAAERAEREKLEAKIEQRRMEDRVAAREQAALKKIEDAGFTPDDIEKIVKEEKCSLDTALRLATLQRESAEPGAADVFSGGRASVPGPRELRPDPEWRKLSPADQRKKGAEIAHGMMDDYLRRQRAAARHG